MKIIPYISCIAAGLFTTGLLYAQQANAEVSNDISKPVQLKTGKLNPADKKAMPPAEKIPSPLPESKPQPGSQTPAQAQTAKPVAATDESKPHSQPQAILKVVDQEKEDEAAKKGVPDTSGKNKTHPVVKSTETQQKID